MKLPREMVLIIWDDCNSTHGWAEEGDVITSGVSPIVTIGFLLAETKDIVAVASSLDCSEPSKIDPVNGVCGSMVIPKRMIRSRRKLK